MTKDWNGREIETARSQGGVLLLADFSDNLLRDPALPWPPPAIVQKLYESRQGSRFVESVSRVVERRLGFYSDLQSINSEDAITWSYFGLLSTRQPRERAAFLNWLLEQVGLKRTGSQHLLHNRSLAARPAPGPRDVDGRT